ncbi:MAG: nucleotidyltransferase domain-containing protein, partial [Bacteroidales bacterium]|nr:nucleotidyltransferase domain-containing protein [Bacteroidales bacterium]
MRLSKTEIEAIKRVANAVFGENTTVSLFGSRTDDNKRGGDIDLLVSCGKKISSTERYMLKIRFLVQLKKAIGDQKIDVLIDGGQKSRVFLKN